MKVTKCFYDCKERDDLRAENELMLECLKSMVDDIDCNDWAGVTMIIKHTVKPLLAKHAPQEADDG